MLKSKKENYYFIADKIIEFLEKNIIIYDEEKIVYNINLNEYTIDIKIIADALDVYYTIPLCTYEFKDGWMIYTSDIFEVISKRALRRMDSLLSQFNSIYNSK